MAPATAEPIDVLHVVGGACSRGGVMSFVNRLTEVATPGIVEHVWKHHSCLPPPTGSARWVCRGRARRSDVNLGSDVCGALADAPGLLSWLKSHPNAILYAHSRMGLIASAIVSRLSGAPLLAHVHARGAHVGLYHTLWRLSHARVIFNSRRTCLHFRRDPADSLIIMPSIPWPAAPPVAAHSGPRFVACGAFVRVKHFDLMLAAFRRVPDPNAELHIYGLDRNPPDSACQAEILTAAGTDARVRLHSYDEHWTSALRVNDIFVHLGCPESFGIVILEAFARGCQLVVLPDTFLDDLPSPLNTVGIVRLAALDEAACARALQQAQRERVGADSGTVWRNRQRAEGLFSVEADRATLKQVYHSLRQANQAGTQGGAPDHEAVARDLDL